ncbi:hypothetical protein C8Q74DRAFT_191568 [Fomes fomentarius]|nr:hypothetical protein C8Q74DRAFT_191568 [Fomes fomentarius]
MYTNVNASMTMLGISQLSALDANTAPFSSVVGTAARAGDVVGSVPRELLSDAGDVVESVDGGEMGRIMPEVPSKLVVSGLLVPEVGVEETRSVVSVAVGVTLVSEGASGVYVNKGGRNEALQAARSQRVSEIYWLEGNEDQPGGADTSVSDFCARTATEASMRVIAKS